MTKAFKTAFLILLLYLLLTPALLFALEYRDDQYGAAGFSPNRETFSMVPYEDIDTFSGGVTLSFEDARIPGNGGLDFVIHRTFNSKNVCSVWTVAGSSVYCNTLGENSWMGLGWTMHFGRVIDSYNSNPVIEMPDGSHHKTYRDINDSTKFITKDYWIYDENAIPKTLTLTDGTKIYYGQTGPVTGSYYATKIEDTNGNEINITYDGIGREIIDYVIDTEGRRYNFYTSTINAGEKLTRITGPGVDVDYIHENNASNSLSFSRLREVRPPVGNPWRYSYGPIDEMTGVTSPAGGIISYTDYDLERFVVAAQNRYFWVLKQRRTSGRDIPSGTWNFTYQSGSSNDTTTVSDPCGRTIRYRHYGYGYSNANSFGTVWKIGLLTEKEIVGEETVSYQWERSDRISYENDFSLFGEDSDIWVPRLDLVTINRDGNTYRTDYQDYDEYGNPERIVETGDGNERRTTTTSYWTREADNIVHNKPATKTIDGSFSSPDFTTTYSYNSNGNLMWISKYGVRTDFDYDNDGNLDYEKDDNDHVTTYRWSYGVINRITNPEYTINRVINSNGTIRSETNGRSKITNFLYDNNLRLREINPPGSQSNTTTISYYSDNSRKTVSRGGFNTIYYYDGFGRPTGTSNSKGVDTDIVYRSCGLKDYSNSEIGDRVDYDDFGRVERILHKDGQDINYTYTGNNVRMSNESNLNTNYTYQTFGDPDEKYLMAVNDTMNNNTTFERNMLGSLTEISQSGITRNFYYTNENFLDRETHPETGTINYGRDQVGNMTSRSDPTDSVSYIYDDINRLRTINADNDVSFTYDDANNRLTMNGPNDVRVAYNDYDDTNRLRRKTVTIGTLSFVTEYRYDGDDNLTDIYYPSGRHVEYSYNNYNEITSVTGFGGTVNSFSYNLAGQPTSYTYRDGSGTAISSKTITYTSRFFTDRIRTDGVIDLDYDYSSRGNVTEIANNINTSWTQNLGYDNIDRLTSFSSTASGSRSFSYSDSGNRSSETINSNTTNYGYSSNRLSSKSNAETASYSYYGNGNLNQIVEPGDTFNLIFDDLNNMVSFEPGASSAVTFDYDGDGMRMAKRTGSETTYYQYDEAGRVISEYLFTDAGLTSVTDFIYANGMLVAKVVEDDPAPLNPPSDPTNLIATATASDQIDLSWTDSSNETEFRIERKTGVGGTYSEIGSVLAGITVYPDNTGLDPETTYYYQVRAYNGEFSGYSIEDDATTLPGAPVDVDGDGIPEGDGSNPCTGGQTSGCDDNCPTISNPDQADADSDGRGDLCDYCNQWTDPTITAAPVSAQHFTELKGAIVMLRDVNSLLPYGWASPEPAATLTIKAVDMTDMRDALGGVLSNLGRNVPGWETNTSSVQGTPVMGSHIEQLRQEVDGICSSE